MFHGWEGCCSKIVNYSIGNNLGGLFHLTIYKENTSIRRKSVFDLDIFSSTDKYEYYVTRYLFLLLYMTNHRLMKHLQAEMTLKQLQNVSPPIMKQVLPLVEQLPPLYMDLAKGREEFTPKPEETRRLVCDISDYYYSSNFILVISEGFVLSFTLNNLISISFQFYVNEHIYLFRLKNYSISCIYYIPIF